MGECGVGECEVGECDGGDGGDAGSEIEEEKIIMIE